MGHTSSCHNKDAKLDVRDREQRSLFTPERASASLGHVTMSCHGSRSARIRSPSPRRDPLCEPRDIASKALRYVASAAMMPQRVAILNVGTPRTMAHPHVAASFALFRRSLVRDGHIVHTFLWLSDGIVSHVNANNGDQHRQYETRASASKLLVSDMWQRVAGEYDATIVNVSTASIPCHYRGCRSFYACSTKIKTELGGPESQSSFLAQRFKVALAYRTAKAWATQNSVAFDWFVRTRTDLLHLQELAPLSSFNRSTGHVPWGIMTSVARYQAMNDHLMVCPAGPLCNAYFEIVEIIHDRCLNGTPRLARLLWPYQRHWVDEMQRLARQATNQSSAVGIELFRHAYTLARDDGPDCRRLICNPRDAYTTGCVAPHLVAFNASCEELRATWRSRTAGGDG